MSIFELKKYCNNNSIRPNDSHGSFIIGSNIEEDGSHFILAWITTALQKLHHSSRLISIDGTYKLTTSGYPCLRAGFADANSRFHSTFIGICKTESSRAYEEFFRLIASNSDEEIYQPEVQMADSDRSITAAMKNVWPLAQRANCFFHMIKNQKNKMKTGRLAQFWPMIKSDLNIIGQKWILLLKIISTLRQMKI